MEKPKKKRTVAITTAIESQGHIAFYAPDTVAECAKEFGHVRPYDHHRDRWAMHVNARYDFPEVVAWLKSFND